MQRHSPVVVTECDRTFPVRTPDAVDIAAIEGKLLLRSSTGLVSRTCRLVRFEGYATAGGARIQPPSRPGVARSSRTGLGHSSGWMGGWAWKGPGQPVDNGGRARCQRDGSGPKVLPGSFSFGRRVPTARYGTNLVAGSLS